MNPLIAGTVRQFAEQLDAQPHNGLPIIARIERATSFDARLQSCWNVPVEWSWSLRGSAGNANAKRIHLHPALQRAQIQEIIETFLHELAHVHERTLYGSGGHSQTWWEAMIRLGEKPWLTRFHNIEAVRTAARKGHTNVLEVSAEELGL